MNKEGVIGILAGLCITFVGMCVFTLYFSSGNLLESYDLLYREKKLGALISIGALPNIPFFFYLLRKHRYVAANGLVGVLICLVGLVALLKAF